MLIVFSPYVLASSSLIEDIPSRSSPIQLSDISFKQIKDLYKPLKKADRDRLRKIRKFESSPYFARIDFEKELKEVMGFHVRLADISRNRENIKNWCDQVTEHKKFITLRADLRKDVDLEISPSEQEIYLKGLGVIDSAWAELFAAADRAVKIIATE